MPYIRANDISDIPLYIGKMRKTATYDYLLSAINNQIPVMVAIDFKVNLFYVPRIIT